MSYAEYLYKHVNTDPATITGSVSSTTNINKNSVVWYRNGKNMEINAILGWNGSGDSGSVFTFRI